MRTVLRALSLVFAVGVVAMLTSNASREDSGCSAQSNGKPQAGSSPQVVKPSALPSVQPTPPPAPAPEPVVPGPEPSNRFMGASKAAPVFIPPPPAAKTPAPVPQQAK